MQPVHHQNLFLTIPDEVFDHFFSPLSLRDVFACCCACKNFSRATGEHNSSFWQRTFTRFVKPYYLQKVEANQTVFQACIEGYRIQQNFIKSNFKTYSFESPPIQCLALSDGKLFSGYGRDCTVQIWDIKKRLCEHTIILPPKILDKWTNCLKIFDKKIYVSDSRKVHVFDLETREPLDESWCEKTLNCHVDYIGDFNGKPYAIGEDGATLSWEEKHFKFKESDHASATSANEKIYLGYDDGKIHVYSLETKKRLSVIEIGGKKMGPTFIEVNPLLVLDDKLYFGCGDGTIRAHDLETEKEPRIFEEIHEMVNRLVVFDGKLFSLSEREIKIWNPETGQCLNTLKVDKATDLIIDQGQIYVSCKKGIKILDFTIER